MAVTQDWARTREGRLLETFVDLADTLVEDFDVVEFFASLTERVVELGLAVSAGFRSVQAMADVATIGLLQQRELDRAHTVEGQLQRALQTRIGIEQAKGVVSEQLGIEMDAAFVLLRGYSRANNAKLHDVARDVVTGVLAASDPTATP